MSTQCRQRAGRAAELKDTRLFERLPQPAPLTQCGVGPSRGFHSKCDRCGLLQPRPSRHRGIDMTPRVRRCRRRGTIEMLDDRQHGALELQHQACIDDVLAGGAPVHVSSGVAVNGFDCAGQLTNERNRKVAVVCGRSGDIADIEPLSLRGFPNRGGGVRRDDAELGFGLRKCALPRRALPGAARGRTGGQRPLNRRTRNRKGLSFRR